MSETEQEKPDGPCPVCGASLDSIGVVILSRTAAWKDCPPVIVEDRFSKCGECGEEWYDSNQANRHTLALLKATVASLTSQLAEARKETAEADDVVVTLVAKLIAFRSELDAERAARAREVTIQHAYARFVSAVRRAANGYDHVFQFNVLAALTDLTTILGKIPPETKNLKHEGATWRGVSGVCPACYEYATMINPKYHPDSDVGPFDFACVLCGHLHDSPSDPTDESLCIRRAPSGEQVDHG